MAKNSTFKERTKKNQNDLKKDIKSKTVLTESKKNNTKK